MTTTDSGPGVLFDIDGTLLDTNYLHALAWWQAMRDAGVTGVSMADTHQAIGIANEGLVRKLTGGDSDHVLDSAVEAHTRRYDALRDQIVAFAGAAELLQRCADVGLRVVLATSGKAADLDWMLPAIGVDRGLLSGSTTSDDVAESKPAPDLLTAAMDRHGLDPQHTVAVGDTVWDVRAAHDAGIACIALTCGGIAACQLRDAGADEVWAGPADLLEHLDVSLMAEISRS